MEIKKTTRYDIFDTTEKLSVGCVGFVLVLALQGVLLFALAYVESEILKVFHPHEYPLWPFAAGTAIVAWLFSLSRPLK